MDYFLILLLLFFLEPSSMENNSGLNSNSTLSIISSISLSSSTESFTDSDTVSDLTLSSSIPPDLPLSLLESENEGEEGLLNENEDQSQPQANVLSLRHTHHHNHNFGPHFEENEVSVNVEEFFEVTLDCKVSLLEDKLVSWVRSRHKSAQQLDLLTLGLANHSSDARIFSNFKYPNNWALTIKNVSRNDAGLYKCTISTHPPKVLEISLTVEAPEVFIVNSRYERIQDVYYMEGSTLKLICIVNNIKSKIVNWYKNKELLNQDLTRGGISIKTDMTTSQAKSVLNVALITKKDSGNFVCIAPPFKNASVSVHVLSAGENPAELYHNSGKRRLPLTFISFIFISVSTWTYNCNYLFLIFCSIFLSDFFYQS